LTLKDKEIDPVCLPSVHKALRILLDEKLEKTSVLIKGIIEHLCFIGEHVPTNKIEQTTSFKKNLVYFGFIIQSEDKNFLAFRGTETPQEWVSDLLTLQTEINDHIKGSDDYKGISVHLGIMLQYSAFMNLINQTLEKLGGKAPLYVTGHSLGGALSVLPSFIIAAYNKEKTLATEVLNYSFAAPRVGNKAFATKLVDLVPNCYRIVNCADCIPLLPPTDLDDLDFEHGGMLYDYLFHKEDMAGNHRLASNYTLAVNSEVPVNKPALPDYPISCR
jgi:predicted lipase